MRTLAILALLAGCGSPAVAPQGPAPVEATVVLAMPGLIDAHVHLALGGADRDGAAKTLRAGFTTVRDLGSTGGAGIALRDAIARGETVGPRMIVAGAGIGGPGGACDGAAGVPVALGTDAIVIPHGDNARELGALVEAGLSPAAAIRAATIDAARLLDVPAGTLAAGALADVIAVRGDPLANVAALRDVVFVMKSGTQVRD